MNLPRLLVIMGSGETAPTMKVPHRRVFERIIESGNPTRPVMLDTPFGFQENAPILAASTTKYFSDSVSQDVAVAGLERTDTGDTASIEAAMATIRDANWIFAGPGSPTFALRQWHGPGLRDVLAEKLRPTDPGGGGALVFSSAAALTLGVVTVPVYEIYKVGMDPWWEPGLDLLSELAAPADDPPREGADDGERDGVAAVDVAGVLDECDHDAAPSARRAARAASRPWSSSWSCRARARLRCRSSQA